MSVLQVFTKKDSSYTRSSDPSVMTSNVLDAKLHYGYDPDAEFKERGNLFSAIQYGRELEDAPDQPKENTDNQGFLDKFIETLKALFDGDASAATSSSGAVNLEQMEASDVSGSSDNQKNAQSLMQENLGGNSIEQFLLDGGAASAGDGLFGNFGQTASFAMANGNAGVGTNTGPAGNPGDGDPNAGGPDGIASTPMLTVQPTSGLENSPIPLLIAASITDASGAEILTVTISNLPSGATLSAGNNNGDGSWTLLPQELTGLQLIPSTDFSGVVDLHVSATSVENNTSEMVSADLQVVIKGVASAPILSVQDVTGLEDSSIPLVIDTYSNDADEVITVIIGNVPTGATLSAGINNGDGTWTLTPAELSGLTFNPSLNFSGPVNLSVTSVSTEDGTSAQTQQSFNIMVEGVADAPNISADPVAAFEYTPAPINIAASLNDNDGSETLVINVGGVPDGAVLSAGTDNGDGTWTLTPDQLAGLMITPPEFYSGAFDLLISATAYENGTSATTSLPPVTVNVTGVANMPDLSVINANGLEGSPVPLSIAAALRDTDGSETLAIIVGNIPAGASLSAGIDNGDGTWTLTQAELVGLNIILPTDYYGQIELSVQAVATEGSDTAVNSSTLSVDVLPIAHAPLVTVSPAAGVEDVALPLNITIQPQDAFGVISITIANLPPGATLSAGIDNGDGTWTLTTAELSGLVLNPAEDWSGSLNLSVSATSSLNGTQASTTTPLPVLIEGVADGPDLNVVDAVGLEDTATLIEIDAALIDNDGSEDLQVLVSGVPLGVTLSAGVDNGDGSWTLQASDLVNLSLNPPTNYSGNFTLSITATSVEGATSASVDAILNVSISGVADVPDLIVQSASGNEGTSILLDISASLTDTDGSETLSIIVRNVPSNAVLSAGIDNGDGSWTLTKDQLSGLTITPAAHESGLLNLSIVAIASEDGTTAQTTPIILPVTIIGTADLPILSVNPAAGVEDVAIALNIDVALTDTDGSDILSVEISGLPEGATLSAGTDNGDGSWTLTETELVGLTLNPPLNYSGNFDLLVSAISTEGIYTARVDAVLKVDITGVADMPNLSVEPASGLEGSPIALDIAASLNDTDGSELLSVIIGNVSPGAVLSAGVNNGDGTWTLTHAQLSGLTITPAPYESGVMNLSIVAIASEDGTTAQTSPVSLPVMITGVANAPNLSVQAASGLEDTAIPLVISASLVDADETLTITISGVPTGASLTAGIDNGDGSWTLTPAQLTGLILNPPSNYSGNFSLSISAVSSDGASTDHTDAILEVDITGVADMPELEVVPASGLENTPIALNITSALIDTDGSETLSITISGVPTGAILSAGLNVGGGVWVLTPAQLAGLTLTPLNNYNGAFELTVTALSSEDGTTASLSESLPVTVVGVGAAPILSVSAATGLEDNAIPLSIVSQLSDASETLSLVIGGVPAGATLSHGLYAGNGNWSLSPSDLTNLTITPPVNFSGVINLTVTAVSTETNGASETISAALNVTVSPVADAPVLSVSTVTGAEDTTISLNIDAALTDIDGSEVLTAQISGVPAGASLSAGTNMGGGIWSLTAAQLNNLRITPATNSDADFSLTISVTSKEPNGASSTVSTMLPVIVNAVADTPIATASNAASLTNQVDLTIGGTLGDTDGSESLTYIIHGVPDGFALNKGINNGDNTWTLRPGDLAGLKMTAPEQFDGQLNLNVTAISHEAIGGDVKTSAPASFHARFGDYANGYLVSLGIDVNIGGIGVGVHVGPLLEIDLLPATGGLLETSGIYTKEDTSFLIADAPGLLSISLISAVIGLLSVIEFSNVAEGVTFSQGTKINATTWHFTTEELNNLYMTVPANSSNDFTILVTAKLLFIADIDLVSVPIHVMAVADTPTLTASVGPGTEDSFIALNIAGGLTDTDGSESLSFLISGMPAGFALNKGINNGNGTWSLLPSDLSGLTIIPEENFSGTVNLKVSAISTESEGDQSVRQQNLTVNIGAVTDAPIIAAVAAVTNEDQQVLLDLGITLRDTDGSEQISSVIISGLPAGASMVGAIDNGDGTWSADIMNLNQVAFVPPPNAHGDYNITITAVSRETSTGATASTTSSISIHVDQVADAPVVTATNSTGDAGGAIALHLGAALVDMDGSETLTAVISGVPENALLSAGLNNGDGTWTLTPSELSNLTITPPENFVGDISLSMTAYSRDGNSSVASINQNFTVHVMVPPMSSMSFDGNDLMANQNGWAGNDNAQPEVTIEQMDTIFDNPDAAPDAGNDHDQIFQNHNIA